MKCEFDIYCPCIAKNNLINEIKKYVYHYSGTVDYVEEGFIRKHLHFFIKVDDKYESEIRYMLKQIQNF